ncbi:MAG: MT-A70 family methyltransferase [Candidatus Aminicenantales bacterium]
MTSAKNESNKLAAHDLLSLGLCKYKTILADPPWQFSNRTGKMAPEHKRLMRYSTMSLQEIMELPVSQLAQPSCHLYLWVPNALVLEGLEVLKRWGFTYKTNIVWYKIRKDGGPDGRGVGFYFRNVTELVLFGVRGHMRTMTPGRTQVNIISSRKREHSRKPDELYGIIEKCSPGPYLELFARHERLGWDHWGNEVGNSRGKVFPAYRGGEIETKKQLALLESQPYKSRRIRPEAKHRGRIRRSI